MPPSSSVSESAAGTGPQRRASWRTNLLSKCSLSCSVVFVCAAFGWGAWQRRWIADDGLIVLRTVRNLLAGYGPVFNMGERVESNTSTVWTYLVYMGGLIGGPIRLEYVVLAIALALSVAGMALVMLGAAQLYAPGISGKRALLLPAGALVYIAIPPARDFATSGLENCLVIAWIGALWWMMVRWSQQTRTDPWFIGSLSVVAGLSVLVRPELALIGGLALVMLLVATPGWRHRLLIVAAGGLLPVGYEIFRMGYYGLLVPQTALAKDASGAKWSQGFIYLANFNGPYALWLPAVLLVVIGLVLVVPRSDSARPLGRSSVKGSVTSRLRSPAAVVIFMVFSGLAQGVYWIRQGGDFMHARVLLAPIFCLLAPVSVIPVVIPDGLRVERDRRHLLAGAAAVGWLAVAGWSLWAANSPGMGSDATRVTYSGIVDERRFYAQATGHAHPLTAADYLDYPRMRAVLTAINNTPDGALLLPAGNYDQWDVVPAYPPPPPPPGVSMESWRRQIAPHTVFFTNLGMLGMNVGLSTRVIDQIGLANPIAAHTARLEDGRIGHDKNLFPDWAVAEGPWLKRHPYVPPYLDEGWIKEAEAALKCPQTESMLTSIQAPLGIRRFFSNLVHAFEFTRYRIDRVPGYELRRCGLDEPKSASTPYTGFPATGP